MHLPGLPLDQLAWLFHEHPAKYSLLLSPCIILFVEASAYIAVRMDSEIRPYLFGLEK
jgi:hypothetical protein